MLRIAKILCPRDFSEYSGKAYDYAQSLAQHYGARLLLQHVVQPLTSIYPDYAFPDSINEVFWNLDTQAEKKLEEFAAAHPVKGFQRERVVESGTVSDCVLALAEKAGVDLIVMGTHGRHGFDRLTMGSVTEKVLRKARCPVLVVRKPAHDFVAPSDAVEPVHLKKILFCTDFSEHSSRARRQALPADSANRLGNGRGFGDYGSAGPQCGGPGFVRVYHPPGDPVGELPGAGGAHLIQHLPGGERAGGGRRGKSRKCGMILTPRQSSE